MKADDPIRFDPRTKAFLILCINLLLFASGRFLYECILFLSALFFPLISGCRKSVVHYLAAFTVMVFVDRIFLAGTESFISSLLSFIFVTLRKFLPCLIVGRWILMTTEVSECVAVMRKMKFPDSVIIPISVVFRYFPTIKEEWTAIRNAMKMRRIKISFEHVIVPLLISAVNTSEELSAAALCRGLDNPNEHTCLYPACLSAKDVVLFLILAIAALFVLLLKGAGYL